MYYSSIDSVYSWSSIDALDSTTFHLAIVLPEEVSQTKKPLEVEFTLDGERQILDFR